MATSSVIPSKNVKWKGLPLLFGAVVAASGKMFTVEWKNPPKNFPPRTEHFYGADHSKRSLVEFLPNE